MRPPGFAKVLRLRETRGQEVSGVLAKTSKGMDLSLGCPRGQHSPPETHRRRKEASSLSPGSALVLGVWSRAATPAPRLGAWSPRMRVWSWWSWWSGGGGA